MKKFLILFLLVIPAAAAMAMDDTVKDVLLSPEVITAVIGLIVAILSGAGAPAYVTWFVSQTVPMVVDAVEQKDKAGQLGDAAKNGVDKNALKKELARQLAYDTLPIVVRLLGGPKLRGRIDSQIEAAVHKTPSTNGKK